MPNMINTYIESLKPQVKARELELTHSRKDKDHLALRVLKLLIQHWERSTHMTQLSMIQALPDMGCHDRFEFAKGDGSVTTKRKLRDLIEYLRKKHTMPILSTPGVKKGRIVVVQPGYWLARDSAESAAYAARRVEEIEAVHKSALRTLAAVRKSCLLD